MHKVHDLDPLYATVGISLACEEHLHGRIISREV